MRPLLLLLPLLALLAVPGHAEDNSLQRLEFSGDTYVRGAAPPLPPGATGALFAAGETLRSQTETTGSAHLIGRRITVAAPVGGSLYAAGYEIDLNAEIRGDATLAARSIHVSAPIDGALRAAAADLTVTAPVGALLVTARRVRIDSVVAGDARITARSVEFGPNSRIDGQLILSERSAAPVSERVAPADRVARTIDVERPAMPGALAWVAGVLASLVFGAGAVLAMQAALLGGAPVWAEDLAFDMAERPFRSLGAGFLTLAAAAGSIPLLAVTIIGIPLIFVMVFLLPLLLLAGYALGAWALGAAIWRAADKPAPLGFGRRMLIAVIGLAAAALLALVPVLGWMVGVALTLAGVGAASTRWVTGRSL